MSNMGALVSQDPKLDNVKENWGGVQPHFCPCPFSLLGRGVIHRFLPVFGSYQKLTAKLPKTGKNDFRVYFGTTLYKLSNYIICTISIYLLPAHVILLPIK